MEYLDLAAAECFDGRRYGRHSIAVAGLYFDIVRNSTRTAAGPVSCLITFF